MCIYSVYLNLFVELFNCNLLLSISDNFGNGFQYVLVRNIYNFTLHSFIGQGHTTRHEEGMKCVKDGAISSCIQFGISLFSFSSFLS